VFGEDSQPKCKVLPQPLTKLHQICYFSIPGDSGEEKHLLAVSTEDGRILFYDTSMTSPHNDVSKDDSPIRDVRPKAQLGGKGAGVTNRIKDFEVLLLPSTTETSTTKDRELAVVTAGSDGTIRLFSIPAQDLVKEGEGDKVLQVGNMTGLYETANRITCLKAFVMLPSGTTEGDDFADFDSMADESEEESEDDST
jgi:protein MAK11